MLVCANFHQWQVILPNWLGIETVLNTIPNINSKWGYVLYHFRIYYAGISYKYTIDLTAALTSPQEGSSLCLH